MIIKPPKKTVLTTGCSPVTMGFSPHRLTWRRPSPRRPRRRRWRWTNPRPAPRRPAPRRSSATSRPPRRTWPRLLGAAGETRVCGGNPMENPWNSYETHGNRMEIPLKSQGNPVEIRWKYGIGWLPEITWIELWDSWRWLAGNMVNGSWRFQS